MTPELQKFSDTLQASGLSAEMHMLIAEDPLLLEKMYENYLMKKDAMAKNDSTAWKNILNSETRLLEAFQE